VQVGQAGDERRALGALDLGLFGAQAGELVLAPIVQRRSVRTGMVLRRGELEQLGVDAPQLDLGLAGPQHRVDRHAQALVELGLKLEHLELRHRQLVIVRPYRKVLHARPARQYSR
jgi:hypothetical protein